MNREKITIIKLGDVLQQQDKSKVKAGDGCDTGTYPFYTCSNELTKRYSEAQYKGPALIFGTGGKASIHFCNEPFSTSTDCLVYYPSSNNVDLNVINKYLRANIHLLENGFKGAGLKHISREYISNLEIPLPPLDVQKQIALNLDQVTKVIAEHKELLAKYDLLIKSRFIEMFGDPVTNDKGWDTKPLEEICSSIVDCPHSTPNYTNENTGFMCIRTSIVKKNKILWDEIEYIQEDEFNKRIQRKRPVKGDIVYTREGAILGIAAIIDRDCNVALGQRSMLLSPDARFCTSQFLSNAMNTNSFLTNATKGISGSASPHINVGDIKVFKMIVPPLELQQQFADFVQQIDKSKLVVQQSLEKAETLYKSLMQEYFAA